MRRLVSAKNPLSYTMAGFVSITKDMDGVETIQISVALVKPEALTGWWNNTIPDQDAKATIIINPHSAEYSNDKCNTLRDMVMVRH